MIMLLFALILTTIGIAYMVYAVRWNRDNDDKAMTAAGLVPIAIAALLVFFACIYSQDAGEVVVKRSISGALAGYTEEAGFHTKKPWESTISYDVRNNLISLYRDAEYKYDGGAAEGACVTVNDNGGASADIDLQVVYSLEVIYFSSYFN